MSKLFPNVQVAVKRGGGASGYQAKRSVGVWQTFGIRLIDPLLRFWELLVGKM